MSITWASVMLYDDEYRYQQARFKFPWGADSQHLSSTKLVRRDTKDGGKIGKGQHLRGPRSQEDTAETGRTCDFFNEGKVCPHKPCRFRHACSICGKKDHRQPDHAMATRAAPDAPIQMRKPESQPAAGRRE